MNGKQSRKRGEALNLRINGLFGSAYGVIVRESRRHNLNVYFLISDFFMIHFEEFSAAPLYFLMKQISFSREKLCDVSQKHSFLD